MLKQGLAVIAISALTSAPIHAGFDQDGFSDVFVVTSAGNLQWYTGTGTENQVTFKRNVVTDGQVRAVTTDYFDTNENADLFVGRESQTAWYESTDATGGYQFVSTPISTATANGLAIGKFNGQSNPSYLFLANTSNNIIQYRNTGPGQLTWVRNLTDGHAVATGDFSGDGLGDLFVAKSGTLSWYRGTSAQDGLAHVMNLDTLANAQAFAINDLDGDGLGDLLVVRDTGVVGWYKYAGLDAAPTLVANFGTDATTIAVGDVDGDGTNEVLVGRSSGTVQWYAATGVGEITFLNEATAFGSGGIVDIAIFPVPEPSSLLLTGAMGFTLLFWRKR